MFKRISVPEEEPIGARFPIPGSSLKAPTGSDREVCILKE